MSRPTPPPGFVPEGFVPEQQATTPAPPPGFVPEGFVPERNYPQASNQPGFWESVHHGLDNMAQGFTYGVRRALPPVDMALEAVGLEHPGPTEGSFVGKASQYAGELAPGTVAGSYALGQRGMALLRNPATAAVSRVQGAVDDIGRSFQQAAAQAPRQTGATEAGALAGSAAGYAAAENSPIPGVQEVAGLAGAVGGGGVIMAPRWLANRAMGYYNKTMKNFNPWSDRGAEMRVNEQRQQRAADPVLAEQAVRDGPRDIPPALVTEQPHLIAEQRRAMLENPALESRLRHQTEAARTVRQGELWGMTEGAQRGDEWAYRVMRRVAPPGTSIEPNDPDLMLRQVYEAYGPAYRQFSGRAQTSGMGVELRDAILDPTISGDPRNQQHALGLVRRLTEDVNQRVDPQTGEVNMQDLFALREAVRNERMQYLSHEPEDRQFRSLYENAENIITRRIEDALPPEQHQRLQDLDRRYRGFSTVRDAMKRGEGLQQRSLQGSLAQRTGETEYSTGGGDLRSITRMGIDVKNLMGNPTLARTTVRGAPPADKQSLRAGFIEQMLNDATSLNQRSGGMEISGMRLREAINQQEKVLRELDIPDKDLTRLRRLASDLVMLERNPDVNVEHLMEDTTSRILEMAGALVGAHLGGQAAQRMGGGSGPQLVLAGRGSTDVRGLLSRALQDRARQRYEGTLTDREGYLRSLTGPTSFARRSGPPIVNSRGITAPITSDMGQTLYEEGTQALDKVKGTR